MLTIEAGDCQDDEGLTKIYSTMILWFQVDKSYPGSEKNQKIALCSIINLEKCGTHKQNQRSQRVLYLHLHIYF